MTAETPRIARSAPRYGPQGPETGAERLPAFCAPLDASGRRSPYRTVWDELGYLHDHPTTGDRLDGCRGCLERFSDS
jgi:hypothetical protein